MDVRDSDPNGCFVPRRIIHSPDLAMPFPGARPEAQASDVMCNGPGASQRKSSCGAMKEMKVLERPKGNAATKAREVHLTDAEWAAIGKAADDRAVSRSRFIVERTLPGLGATAASPRAVELIDKIRGAAEASVWRVQTLAEGEAPIDVLAVCIRIERFKGRFVSKMNFVRDRDGNGGDADDEACYCLNGGGGW